MEQVLVERDFNQPVERIFDYLAEHENLGQIFGLRVERVRDGDNGQRNGVGSVRKLSVKGVLPFEETVTRVEPNQLIEYKITKGSPLRDHRGEMRFSERDGGSHLRYEITFGAAVPGRRQARGREPAQVDRGRPREGRGQGLTGPAGGQSAGADPTSATAASTARTAAPRRAPRPARGSRGSRRPAGTTAAIRWRAVASRPRRSKSSRTPALSRWVEPGQVEHEPGGRARHRADPSASPMSWTFERSSSPASRATTTSPRSSKSSCASWIKP